MMTLKLKRYNSPELERSYIPYEEQKKRRSRINNITKAGIGGSVLAGGGYLAGSAYITNRAKQIAKNAATEKANDQFRRVNSNWLKSGWSRLTGKNKRIENKLVSTMENIDQAASSRIKRAGKIGLGIAGAGTALTLGARSIMKRKAKKQKYYDPTPEKHILLKNK